MTEGKEVDNDAECDCCKSTIEEENNEIVFCDGCNVCVHQACYGVTNIPEGYWYCKSCLEHVKPKCVLCPNTGGAMTKTRDGKQWAHVSCAWWIPEVKIGNPTEMEPIIDIEKISAERWALTCYLCKEKVGACIQCDAQTCTNSFHVTCAHKFGLWMDVDESTGMKFKAYCKTHINEFSPKKKTQKKTKAARQRKSLKDLEATTKILRSVLEKTEKRVIEAEIALKHKQKEIEYLERSQRRFETKCDDIKKSLENEQEKVKQLESRIQRKSTEQAVSKIDEQLGLESIKQSINRNLTDVMTKLTTEEGAEAPKKLPELEFSKERMDYI